MIFLIIFILHVTTTTMTMKIGGGGEEDNLPVIKIEMQNLNGFHVWPNGPRVQDISPMTTPAAAAPMGIASGDGVNFENISSTSFSFEGETTIQFANWTSIPGTGSYTEKLLILTCTSNYPIQWTSSIIPYRRDSTNFRHRTSSFRDEVETFYASELHRSGHNPLDETTPVVYTLPAVYAVAETGGFSSGFVICENPANSSLTSTLYIFTEHGTPFAEQHISNQTTRPVYYNNPEGITVPCRANYIDLQPKLERRALQYNLLPLTKHGDIELVESTVYNPRLGFHVNYSSKTGPNHIGYRYGCKPDNNSAASLEYDFLYIDQRLQRNMSQLLHYNQITNTQRLICTNETLETRHMECAVGPELRSIMRLSTFYLRLKVIKCDTPERCDWFRLCFYKGCPTDIEVTVDTHPCPFWATSCRIRSAIPHGIAQCTVGAVTSFQHFFTALDKNRYWTTSEIPLAALIQLHELNDTYLFPNERVTLTCEVATFMLYPSMKFAAKTSQGTIVLLEKNDPQEKRVLSSSIIFGSSVQKIDVTLMEGMTEVFCLAPWRKSSKWVRSTSRSIMVKYRQSPKIEETDGHRIFYRDQTDRNLVCRSLGYPPAQISWIYTKNGSESQRRIKDVENRAGESILIFPRIDDHLQGTYTCVATNLLETDQFNFTVVVEDAVVGRLSVEMVTGISVGAVLFIVVLVVILILVSRKYALAKREIRNLTSSEIEVFEKGTPSAIHSDSSTGLTGAEKAVQLPFLHTIPEENLIVAQECVLGSGQFGLVVRGFLLGEAVAVKTTKADADVDYFKALLMELKIMAYVGSHKYIVHFHGAVTSKIKQRLVYAVLELSPFGNLLNFVRKNASNFVNLDPQLMNQNDDDITVYGNNEMDSRLNTFIFYKWCREMAEGMAYLAEKKIVHGDLAARNILLFKENVVKITDFGLSRQLYGNVTYTKRNMTPLPFRWMAVESLKHLEFSTMSDVWSFGVTAWEIFALSEVPFGCHEWTADFANNLINGLRLAKPKYAPQHVYDKLLTCWNLEASERPSFVELAEFFQNTLDSLPISPNMNENGESRYANQPAVENQPAKEEAETKLLPKERKSRNFLLRRLYANFDTPPTSKI